jgi:hypothetical protein
MAGSAGTELVGVFERLGRDEFWDLTVGSKLIPVLLEDCDE